MLNYPRDFAFACLCDSDVRSRQQAKQNGGRYLPYFMVFRTFTDRPTRRLRFIILPAFFRLHPNQKSALAIPLNLTLTMIFHALSPNLKPYNCFLNLNTRPELYTNPLKKETKTDTQTKRKICHSRAPVLSLSKEAGIQFVSLRGRRPKRSPQLKTQH